MNLLMFFSISVLDAFMTLFWKGMEAGLPILEQAL